MAPSYSKTPSVDQWWRHAYANSDHIVVKYEIEHGNDLIVPKTKIRFKNVRGVFLFRCHAYNTDTGKSWIECIDNKSGTWRAFRDTELKGVVKQKQRKTRKKVE